MNSTWNRVTKTLWPADRGQKCLTPESGRTYLTLVHVSRTLVEVRERCELSYSGQHGDFAKLLVCCNLFTSICTYKIYVTLCLSYELKLYDVSNENSQKVKGSYRDSYSVPWDTSIHINNTMKINNYDIMAIFHVNYSWFHLLSTLLCPDLFDLLPLGWPLRVWYRCPCTLVQMSLSTPYNL